MRSFKITLLAASAFLTMGTAAQAASGTVVTETRIMPKPYAGADIVDYRIFDINHDGIMTREEVGEKLFYTFDTDGNQLIDNIEWSKPMVITFAPTEQQTIRYVDYNSDGVADTTSVTSQYFLQQTGLSRFDQYGHGLSAERFMDKGFKRIDRDLSGQIDIKEWKESYIASLRPLPQNDTFRYND